MWHAQNCQFKATKLENLIVLKISDSDNEATLKKMKRIFYQKL